MSTALLGKILGRTVARVRRVHYVHSGVVSGAAGPLEFTFEDGTSVVLDACGDGESLSVTAGTWSDPFEEPLSEENRAYVEKSGKWTVFEVSDNDPLRRVIGGRVVRVDEIKNPWQKVVGAQIRVGDTTVKVIVDSDELVVDVA